MKIWVELVMGWMRMVEEMVLPKALIRHPGKQPRGNGANDGIHSLAAMNRPMHRIVGSDEQPSVQECLHEYVMERESISMEQAPD